MTIRGCKGVEPPINLLVRRSIRFDPFVLDIPATVLSAFPKLNRVYAAVRDHERVKAWYAN